MSLGQRVRTILNERHIKQVDFARALGISANYVSLIVNDKKETISDTLAKLIEEQYGYAAQWILTGRGSKTAGNDLTAEKMPDEEVRAVLAFVNTLESLKGKEKR